MLNEGYALLRSLERCGVQLTSRHPAIGIPGKEDGLAVGLDEKGQIARVEYREAHDIAGLWTTRQGMQNSFPILKLQRPLWRVGKDDALRKDVDALKTDEGAKRRLLGYQRRTLNITPAEIIWWNRLRQRVKHLRPFFDTDDPNFKAVPYLMDRFLAAGEVGSFLEGLCMIIKRFHSEIPYALLESILIGNKWDENKKEYHARIPLALDVDDWDNSSKYLNPVASRCVESFVSYCLFKEQGTLEKDGEKGKLGLSALSGEEHLLEKNRMPCPKLPLVGNTYIFSFNNQTPCQVRYKRTSMGIFPVARKEANAIQDSLGWITAEDRKGRTWYPILDLKDRKNDLLIIVYLDSRPDLDVSGAQLLGGVSKLDFSEGNYQAIAGVAIQALRGEEIEEANDLIKVLALRRVDSGRTQISFQWDFTISALVAADREWRTAAENCPAVIMPFFRKELENTIANLKNVPDFVRRSLKDNDSNLVSLLPPCPFPADLVRLTERRWQRYGKGFSFVAGRPVRDVYEVYFARKGEQECLMEDLLGLTIQCTQSLLIGVTHAFHRKKLGELTTEGRFTATLAISALGIYLHKLGIRKEDYMEDIFFCIGRFLSLADTLHYEYCDKVRGGSIPPQLLGNANVQFALDNPISAFDFLSSRIGIYMAWASKTKKGHSKFARWAVGQIGKVMDSLSQKPLPESTTTAQRAQILLGYVARSSRKTEESNEYSNEPYY